jgi:hypothetical protein
MAHFGDEAGQNSVSRWSARVLEEVSVGIPQMSVDLVVRDLVRLS